MDYRARITVGRYIRVSSFASDLGKLKAFRGEYAGPSLLESLEEHGLLQPSMRLHWPDPVARRIWQETRRREVTELQDPVEADGPRMDAAADLWNALQDAGMRSLSGDNHPFDAPKPEWLEFLKRPEQQTFVPHSERRVRVSNEAQPDLHDSDNVQDFYSSWQLLTAIEVADMGVHVRINMADEDIARRVREDIRSKRWPGGRATEAFAPARALRDFERYQAGLDAIEWAHEEERDRTFRLLQGSGGGRIVLTDEQVAARYEIRRTVANEALDRFAVGKDDLLSCCKFLAGRWHEWAREGRPIAADAYKIFLAEGVRLLQIRHDMTFNEIKELVGFQGSGGQRTLEVIWPDWAKEQIDRLIQTLRAPDLTTEQLQTFGEFLQASHQDAVFHRLRSFESHAFEYGHARLVGMHSDLQGMSVAVEQAVRAMGGQGTQLAHMFRGLWDGTDVGRVLKKNKKLLEQGKPPEDLLDDINALGKEGEASEVAADLILAARIRGAVHHALQISNPLELERLLVRVLRAAALTHAHVFSNETVEPARQSSE